MSATNGERIASASETLNIGRELRAALERAARREGRDATNLGRLLIREGLAAREAQERA